MYWYLSNNPSPIRLHKGLSDYYTMWILLTKYNIKPYEWDQILPEDQNALLTLMQYQNEKDKDAQFKAQSQALHNRNSR